MEGTEGRELFIPEEREMMSQSIKLQIYENASLAVNPASLVLDLSSLALNLAGLAVNLASLASSLPFATSIFPALS